MKKSIRLTAVLLCVIMLVPMLTFGYSSEIVENDPVQMPKATPTIDADIASDGGRWSDPAYLNDATLGYFWASNPATSTANIYFAYDDDNLYFAADITDNDSSNGFVVSTGYDNIDQSGSNYPYGFNGDVMTLMLDPLGVFEQSSYQTTAWYNIGIFADNTVKVYRSQANEADITESVEAKGEITANGWKFEISIPWSIIANDVSAASSSKLSATETKLAAVGSESRAACMYMDRYYTSGTTADTWGRFITVCETTYDGTQGVYTNGISAKAYGLTLEHTDLHEHIWGEWVVATEPGCTSIGSKYRTCSDCNASQTADIPAFGHSWGEWQTASEATETTHGTDCRKCNDCSESEQRIIAAANAPEVTVDNFFVKIENASDINHIRYASGVHTTSNSIRNAEDRVDINTKHIGESTVDNVLVRNMPTGGLYSFWIRLNDGNTYIVPVDMSYMEQEVTTNGITLTVHNLYGVKDFFIAEGEYDTYREVADNQIVRISSEKIGADHNYTYTVNNPGIHTVCVRYDDETRENTFFTVNLTVTEPTFEPNGLQLHIGNLDGVKVIRVTYGDYSSSHDIKRADGARYFSALTAIKNAAPYTIQFYENGLVSVSVEYNNGYVKIYQFEAQKKVPSYQVDETAVTFGNIDDLYVIRYAPGEYATSYEIKRADGAKYVMPYAAVDGKITISELEKDTVYTFCVQYNDQSYNYFTLTFGSQPTIDEDEVADVADQRQLLLEDYVIDTNNTDASLILGTPVKKEIVFTFDKAYESSDAVYHHIVTMPDGTYRMYYKATADRRRICYIESSDGLTWTRPSLTTNLYNGAASNIVTGNTVNPDNLFVFYDTNPSVSDSKRLKGIYGQWGDGLFIEWSTNGDGNDFQFWPNETKIMGTPTQTEGAFFDTLNTVYWDSARSQYVAFVRGFHEGDNYNLSASYVQSNGGNITRDIRVAFSDDCINWTTPVPLVYDDGADWQMYANAIVPYYRASQLYVGMPTRYQWPDGASLPVTDIFLMSSRDLINWDRTESPYMTPGQVEGATWKYGDSGYPCIGYIQTGENEMSFYMKEKNSSGTPVLYRYTLRVDGFRMAYGDVEGKELSTKYMTFTGDELEVNYAASSSGKMRVTMTDESGKSIQSNWMTGDDIGAIVNFNGDVSAFRDHYVTLTFELYDASVYSFKFN